MPQKKISPKLLKEILKAQHCEITEYHIYSKLAKKIKHRENGRLLQRIAKDEYKHYKFWLKFTKRELKPKRKSLFFYYWISRIFGTTFGIKLMERGEEQAQINYKAILKQIPEAKEVLEDEEKHEAQLIKLIDEEKLKFIGSIVLGLNDALVELTGALAGLSFAFQDTKLIAPAGLITGIAASFSMASSEYLSNKSEGAHEKAFASALYTGFAYIVTVALLVLPYIIVPVLLPVFFIPHYIVCLVLTLIIAVAIIFFFNFYISVVKDFNFKKRFFEMAFLSLGIAALSFLIGFVVKITMGVEV
ncbi:MAG: VIT1/CCC1 transporter family protein [Spirochaetales bacterium]|nr:VIT1/CCC1 transporter family protein [Spirochaetales bacterium]